MTPPLVAQVAEFCQKRGGLTPKDNLVVAVSGGPDSLCLLHLLTQLAPQFDLTLTVAHLNHQLRGPEADADAAFVRDFASKWNLPISIQTRPVAELAATRQQSIEETARQVRYAFLWQVALEVGANKIAVGHNADDQVETVLMHLLRGSGLAGLRGMRPVMDIATLHLHADDLPSTKFQSPPRLIRPLLDTPRADIETYCQTHSLTPRRDDSNQDTTFFRNRLRHELLPYLETYNPNIRRVLRRTASVVAADVDFLRDHVDQAWRFVLKNASVERVEIDLFNWLSLPLALKRATLRRAVQTLRQHLRDINFEHVETALEIIEKRNTGAQATLPQGLMLTVGYDIFSIADQSAVIPLLNLPQLLVQTTLTLPVPGAIRLPQTNWCFKAELLTADQVSQSQVRQVNPWEAYLDAEMVGEQSALRTRRPGDTFCPLGLGGQHKKLNEFMIDQKIPAGQRDYWPLLIARDQIMWVCGYRPDERACLRPTTRRILHVKFERDMSANKSNEDNGDMSCI